MPQLTPERQFADALRVDGTRPFVTYYDEATGERTELSVRSLANWVAKTHHLLVDELDLGVGDTARVTLSAHWLSVPILLGALSAGLQLIDSGPADVAFVDKTGTTDSADVADVFAVNPARAALGFGDDVPDGMHDYVAAVRPQGDAWAGVVMSASPQDPCLPGFTRGEVADRASTALPAGTRLLSSAAWTGPADWLATVLAPVAVNGSVVFVRHADEATIGRRVSQERATRRLR